ncbi:MAG: tetratricopeptide repeat protein [Chloroflexi bacterium]|nr:tetratricopeptide repeat protein [Chloroflexota bacterium]
MKDKLYFGESREFQEPLDDTQITDFIRANLDQRSAQGLTERIADGGEWWELARDPRILIALCRLAASNPHFSKLPNTELLIILSRSLRTGGPGSSEADSPAQLALEALADEMLREDGDTLDGQQCLEIIGEAAGPESSEGDANDVLKDLLHSGMLLAGEDGRVARFRSPLLQHFFAALSLQRSLQGGTSLRSWLPSYPWSHRLERTLAFAYAMAGHRVGFLRDVLESANVEDVVLATASFLASQENEELAREFLRVDPLNYDLIHEFGRAFRQLRRMDLARGALEAAAKLEPDRALIHQELADVLVELGDLARAGSQYQVAARLCGNEISYHLGMARIFSHESKWPAARAELISAERSLRAAEAEVHHHLAHVCEGEGELEDALSHCQAAIEMNPSPHYWLHLGRLNRRKGRLRPAQEALGRCVELETDSYEAHRELGLIHESIEEFDRAVDELKQAILARGHAEAYADLGRVYRKMGLLARAQTELWRAIRLDPTHTEAHVELGAVYEGLCDLERALEIYRRAGQLSPRQAEPHERMGRVLRLLGSSAEAEIEIRAAAGLNPSRADLFALLGELMMEQGHHARALAEYRRAVELAPGDAAYRHHVGVMHSRLGEYGAAVQALSEALGLAYPDPDQAKAFSGGDPSSDLSPAETHFELGIALEMQGECDRALKHYRSASDLKPEVEPYWTRQGQHCLTQRRHQEAVAAFERSVLLKPHDASLLAQLGQAREGTGHSDLALQAYERAIARMGAAGQGLESATPYVRSSLILVERGRAQEAKKLLCNALDLFPRCAEAHYYLGLLLLDEGSLDQALLNCLAAVESDSGNARFKVALGRCFSARGSSNEATTQLRRAVALAPDLAEAHYHLARIYLDNGLQNDALASASQASMLDGSNPEYARFAGHVAGQQGDTQLALSLLEEAVRRSPDDHRMHRERATALELVGKRKEALDEYRRSLQLSPDNADYEFDVGRLNLLLGRCQDAVESLLRVVARHPNHGKAQGLLGEALVKLGHYEAALDRFELSARLQPDAPASWQGKGTCLASLGRLDDAAHALRRAGMLEGPDFAAREELAAVLPRLGLLEEAHEVLLDVVHGSGLTPRRAGALSDLCCALGRY